MDPTGEGRGLFLVLEGVEGAGKSTQAALLGRWLEERGRSVTLTREPGGTPVGEAVRSVVLGEAGHDVPPGTELLLILAARAAFVDAVVRPALARGHVVVSDRFDLSTFAYQGYGRGIDLDEVARLNAFATGGLRPDLYVVLDVPVVEGADRQRRQGKEGDRFEAAGGAFLGRVREGYLALAEGAGRVELVDGTGTPAAVHERVVRLLERTFPETFGEPGD